ncbi:protein ARK2N isoform X1 [Rhinoderma darwinii]|uniref:protein ARK2N isoform X1 n=1 Tax=Rhinoderma darwinii TaxID=43563 RepID=UPI003F66378C
MKMEAVSKDEQLVDSEVPPHVTQENADSQAEEGALDLQTPPGKDGSEDVPDSSGLASMPCLLMELRRDSSESQLASTESDKPTTGRVYESDSSNHCMLSPSSSGHLADSDTLSSAEENESRRPEAITEGCDTASQGATVARKSRRSRSESETSTMAAKKNRQSSDKQNGRVTKIKGHRSQKHKERIRLLRQKREAAARKKYNLLQDSSTSDSDLTCDSSTSSSDEDEEVSGSSKTITAEIPVDDLKVRGRSTRDQYRRELTQTGKSGLAPTEKLSDRLMEKLSFLIPIFELCGSEDNLEESTEMEERSEVEDTRISPDEEHQDPDNPGTSSGPSVCSPTPPENPVRSRAASKRKRIQPSTASPVDTRVLEYWNRNKPEDGVDAFVRTLAFHLRLVPPEHRLRTQSAMLNLIDAATPPNDPRDCFTALEHWRRFGHTTPQPHLSNSYSSPAPPMLHQRPYFHRQMGPEHPNGFRGAYYNPHEPY